MGLKIVISSAVKLDEKNYIKEKLVEMEKGLHLIKTDWIYDCAEHATTWSVESKQEGITKKILSADWFICLIPKNSVGRITWEELELVLNAVKNGANIVVSVFHPCLLSDEENSAPLPDGHVTFDYVRENAETILGNAHQQYWVDYKSGNKESLQKEFHEEFIRLYYTDKIFRTQRLAGLAKLGKDVVPADIYFDKERAKPANGFIENKYCLRQSVDGELKEAIDRECKFIVLQGAPGSGKTRAMYQLLANPANLLLDSDKEFALGAFANEKIIVVTQDNVNQVYDFLVSEKDIYAHNADIEYSGVPFTRYILFCDQLKDVFGVIIDKGKLYEFFEMVGRFEHVMMIATTIPSAFKNFCERWDGYPGNLKPLNNERLTSVITIPSISDDKDKDEIRSWMNNTFGGTFNPNAETFGDHIPQLNDYKENIVGKLYKNASRFGNIFPYFLSAIQITELFRRDTALFLPIMIVRANIIAKQMSFYNIRNELVDIINFLIDNNVMWVRFTSPNENSTLLNKHLRYEDLDLEYGIDDDEEFMFDGEEYPDSPISTAYTYGVNEIIWEHLLEVDANMHIGNKSTLLFNMRDAKSVNRMAKEFHRAFPDIKNLRRILPRIPRNESYEKSCVALWKYIYEQCEAMNVAESDEFEFLTTIGILVGHAKEFSNVEKALAILEKKQLKPDYTILGELYSVGQRLSEEYRDEISKYIDKICEEYELSHNSLFSLSRKITFLDIPFDEAIKIVESAKYDVRGVLLSLNEIPPVISGEDLEYKNLVRLLETLLNRCKNADQWLRVLGLYKSLGITLRRKMIRQLFFDVANDNINQIYDNLQKITLNEHKDVVDEEYREACFFSAVESSGCFEHTRRIYELYTDIFHKDNPRLISRVLSAVKNNEFQKARNFLIEANERFKTTSGSELNSICFNNLIKVAPNMDEAVALVPYIPHLQEQTLVNILNIIKKKRKAKDSSDNNVKDAKIFFYAYSVIMREEFFEFRKSPYVVGILYDIARTAKQERFIRDKFLSHLSKEQKHELIDYSTSITSIRINKNYRPLDEIWDIFNTCRQYHREKYVNSEIYNSMMRKIRYLCKEENELQAQRDRLRKVIEEDSNRIIKDAYFYTSQYCFFPEKQIVDGNGNISTEFKRDLLLSGISKLKPLNNVLLALIKEYDFDVVWKFYEFIVENYEQSGKCKELRPDIRTVTYLVEAAKSKEQFERAKEESKRWCSQRLLNSNAIYCTAYDDKVCELGLEEEEKQEKQEKQEKREKGAYKGVSSQDYKQRADAVVKKAQQIIDDCGSLTSTQLNRGLARVSEIIKDIDKATNLSSENIAKCKSGTYNNVLKNLIDADAYKGKIALDVRSYTYLVQLSPNREAVKRWMDELQKRKDVYKYDIVVCGTIDQSLEVCKADIDMAMEYFRFWEAIISDIGYDPSDPTSIDDCASKANYNGVDDYDGYWLNRGTHSTRVMGYYCKLHKRGEVDVVALRFIKQQMELFAKYGVKFPCYYYKQEVFDFQKEIEAHKDLLNEN